MKNYSARSSHIEKTTTSLHPPKLQICKVPEWQEITFAKWNIHLDSRKLKAYRKDPWGFLAKRFHRSETAIRAIHAFFKNGACCTGTKANGKQCRRSLYYKPKSDDDWEHRIFIKSLPRTFDFVVGLSDRCNKHKDPSLHKRIDPDSAKIEPWEFSYGFPDW